MANWLTVLGGNLALTLLARALGVANAAILARMLQPERFGLYSYALLIVTALSVLAQFGIPTVVMREIAANEAHGNWQEARGVIRWAYLSIGALTCIILIVVGIYFFSQQDSWSQTKLMTYGMAIFLVPLFALDEIRVAILNGLRYAMLSRVPGELLRSLFVFVILICFTLVLSKDVRFDSAVAMAILVVASLIAYASGALILKRVEPEELRKGRPKFALGYWTTSAFPIALTAGVGFLNQSASTVILGAFLSDTEVGYFRIATLGSSIVLVALAAINNILAPYFSQAYARADLASLQALAIRSSRVSFSIAVLIVLIYIVLGRIAINMVFGADYSDSYSPLVILASAQLITAATSSASMILYMSGRGKEVLVGSALGAIVNISVSFVLVPKYGILGAAAAAVISESLWSITWTWLLWRRLGLIACLFSFNSVVTRQP